MGYNVLANDQSHASDTTLSVYGWSRLSKLGTSVSIDADGTFSYDSTHVAETAALHPGETLTDETNYTVVDANGHYATATVKITVTGVADAPDDFYAAATVGVREVAAPGVLSNDPDYQADPAATVVVDFDAASELGVQG